MQIAEEKNFKSVPNYGLAWTERFSEQSLEFTPHELRPADMDLLLGSPDPKAPSFTEVLAEVSYAILVYALGIESVKYLIQ